MDQARENKSREREAQWLERLGRQAGSGQSVAAFCRAESISQATFYLWRKRLAAHSRIPAFRATPSTPAPFIDLGTIDERAGGTSGWDIRLDLGDGVTLSIARR